jgi:hypothetical protein
MQLGNQVSVDDLAMLALDLIAMQEKQSLEFAVILVGGEFYLEQIRKEAFYECYTKRHGHVI